MIIKTIQTESKHNRILVFSPETSYEQDLLKEIVKTGFCLSVTYSPCDQVTIQEISIPMYCRKTT